MATDDVTPGPDTPTRRGKSRPRKRDRHTATIIQLPRSCRLDVRDALLNNQSTPEVTPPPELQAAIEARAREMAEEAYQICLEHLRRRVAYHSEWNQPREILLRDAYAALADGDLGDALARTYRRKLVGLVHDAQRAASIGNKFALLADEVSKAAGVDEND